MFIFPKKSRISANFFMLGGITTRFRIYLFGIMTFVVWCGRLLFFRIAISLSLFANMVVLHCDYSCLQHKRSVEQPLSPRSVFV